MKYIRRSVFIIKFDGNIIEVFGTEAAADAYLDRLEKANIRDDVTASLVCDEWPVEFEVEEKDNGL